MPSIKNKSVLYYKKSGFLWHHEPQFFIITRRFLLLIMNTFSNGDLIALTEGSNEFNKIKFVKDTYLFNKSTVYLE